jgi:hypothetical protein
MHFISDSFHTGEDDSQSSGCEVDTTRTSGWGTMLQSFSYILPIKRDEVVTNSEVRKFAGRWIMRQPHCRLLQSVHFQGRRSETG